MESGNENYLMTAKTQFGLEDLLVDELKRLGAGGIEKHNRAVSFTGDKGFMYKANLCLRTALRILKPIKTFNIVNEEGLYREIGKINWEDFMGVDDTLAIDCAVNSDFFTHSQFMAQKAKDAVVDQFRNKYGRRPSVDLDQPTLRVNLHIFKNTCTVSLDSSGESLHKRGYREQTNKAPVNEVLAAGMVLLSGWDRRTPLIDPMCGSGTILIEAAMIANNIPAGYFRKKYGFENWRDFDAALWETIFNAAIDKISEENQQITGVEIAADVARMATENILNAKVEDTVKVFCSSFQDFEPWEHIQKTTGRPILIMNPPYGERLEEDNINALYKSIGDTLKKKYAGCDAWIITSNPEAMKSIGLHATRRIGLFNGPLECKFLKFSMYDGTKKIHKIKPKDENGAGHAAE
ncbi:MAG TPA: THUMP domain-containing protein [Bacteroidia bacterium]|jgi:putative N6-adenine-specific DNA methylase|nr:THUMP domain-containing protein [Bacteroidia bacterium]